MNLRFAGKHDSDILATPNKHCTIVSIKALPCGRQEWQADNLLSGLHCCCCSYFLKKYEHFQIKVVKYNDRSPVRNLCINIS